MRNLTAQGLRVCFAGLCFVAVAKANPIYVAPAAAGGDDGNDGLSWASPKATPQAGITAAGSGGEVIISNGTYVLSSPIAITAPALLRSFENDPATVIIDGNASVRCLSIGTGANGTIVAGITFTNGSSSVGGGIQVSGTGHADTVISNVVVTACVSTGAGGGADLRSGTLRDSHIIGNTASSYGGGVYNISGVVRVDGCIIEANASGSSLEGGAGLWLQSSATNRVVDSVFRDNTGPATLRLYAGAEAVVEGCDVPGDLTLQSTSPCKDNGMQLDWMTATATDLAGEPRVASGTVDMGAYEFPANPAGSMILFR